MSATVTKTNLSTPLATATDHLLRGEADCERVNIVLDQLLEGRQLEEKDADYLIDHADDCSPCFDDIKKQRVFVDFLSTRLDRKPVPAGLPRAIMARLEAELA